MPQDRQSVRLSVVATLSLVPLLLTGCVTGATRGPSSSPLPDVATGNWQFSSAAVAAARLPILSGTVSGTAAAATGMLHTQGVSSCVTPSTPFEVSGAADSSGVLTLTGPLAGGTLTITGTLASDGKSLTEATYNVTGGSCGFVKPADATAQAFTPISGTYTGSFTDADGVVATVSANLSQSPSAATTGNYTLSGTATLPNNPCFSTQNLTVSNTQVTGGTFTFTFTDPNTFASVTASGTFSPDATTLTVAPWTLSNCSTDTGHGSMTQQSSVNPA